MSPKGHPLIGIRQTASLPNSYGMLSKEESKWLRPPCTGQLQCGPVFLTRLPDPNLSVVEVDLMGGVVRDVLVASLGHIAG